jgi:hypothetical protein
LRAIDRSSTETFAIVFQTSIFVVIACSKLTSELRMAFYYHTFAESYTNLHSHVLSIKTRTVKQSPRAAQVLETTFVCERSEVGARRLRGVLPCIDARKERQCRRGNGQGLEVEHFVKYNL